MSVKPLGGRPGREPKPTDRLTIQITRRARDQIVLVLDEALSEEENWLPGNKREHNRLKYLARILTEEKS